MYHLKNNNNCLFSIAMKMNPLDENALPKSK